MAKPTTFSTTIKSFIYSFIDESDRGCVIAIGALIDDMLRELLRTHLIRLSGQTNFVDGLLDPNANGMLAKYSSRIKVVIALGLVDCKYNAALKAIGKVRNEFAHKLHLRKIEQRHADILIGNLPSNEKQLTKQLADTLAGFKSCDREWSVVRMIFILAAFPIVHVLRSAINNDRRRLRIIAKALEDTPLRLPTRKR